MIENIFPLSLFRMLKLVQIQYEASLNVLFVLMKHAHSTEKAETAKYAKRTYNIAYAPLVF